jgi:hypothetical protein
MSCQDDIQDFCQRRLATILNKKWHLDALIGIGGMAAVYEATHRTGARAAIKILHPELAALGEFRTRFQREAYIANKIDHPGTVKVMDDDIDEQGFPYIVMELLRGETVEELARDTGGVLPPPDVLTIAMRTLDVLEAAHAAGVIHRDIKPENLFVTTGGEMKVLDFGIARVKDSLGGHATRTGVMMGTPAFMPPEQALGRTKRIDERTDLWAVGAVMFNLLTGRNVHEGETDNEMIVSAATRPARSLAKAMPEAPLDLVSLVDCALAFDPERRFGSAGRMKAELRKLLDLGRAAEAPLGAVRRPPAETVPARPAAAEEDAARKLAQDLARELMDVSELSAPEDVRTVTDMFRLIELALVARVQYGPDHPEGRRRMEAAVAHAMKAVAGRTEGLMWNVTPYSFEIGEHAVWEPEQPYDRVPYQLFSDGIRGIGFQPGVREGEMEGLIRLLAVDPASEVSPEDDFATMLWDASYEHIVHYAVSSFAEGDQTERSCFERERQKVIDLARYDTGRVLEACWRAGGGAGGGTPPEDVRKLIDEIMKTGYRLSKEAAARAAGMQAGEDASGPVPVWLVDPAEQAMLDARMSVDTTGLSERFALVAAHAFMMYEAGGIAAAITVPLRRAMDALAAGAPRAAIDLLKALCGAVESRDDAGETERLRASLAGAIISEGVMSSILAGALSEGEGGEAVEGLKVILATIDNTHVVEVLRVLPKTGEGPLRTLLMSYVLRAARGREEELGRMLPAMDVDVGLAILRVLAEIGTPAARKALAGALDHREPLIRIEAIGLVEGVHSEKLRGELRALLEERKADVRITALRTIERYGIRAAGPYLVLRIKSDDFDGLPAEEKQQALETLCALMKTRAEQVCIELLEATPLVTTGAHEQTRELAAQTLGKIGDSQAVAESLDRMAKKKWRNTEKVRIASASAFRHVSQKVDIRSLQKERKP